MKERRTLRCNKECLHKYHLALLSVVMVTVPFFNGINSIAIGVYAGFLFFCSGIRVRKSLPEIILVVAVGAFFLLTILDPRGFFLDAGKHLGFLLRLLPLFLIPIAYSSWSGKRISMEEITMILTVSSLCAMFFGIYTAIEFYTRPEEHFSFIHLPHTITGKYHSVYFSIQLGINVLLAAFSFNRTKSYYYLLIAIVLFVFMTLLGKRMALLALCALAMLFVLRNLNLKAILVFLFSVGIAGAVYLYSPYNRWRMEQFDSNGEGSERMIMMTESMNIIKDHFFVGVSPIGVSSELEEKYSERGIATPFYSNNPHDLPLYVFMAFGLFGFLTYYILQLMLLVVGIRGYKTAFIYVLLFFLAVSVSETILIRQNGIVLYAFILPIIFYEGRKDT